MGPYMSSEALELGLIDGMAHRDDLYDKILPKVFGIEKDNLSYLYLHRYWQRVGVYKYKKLQKKGSSFFNKSRNKIGYVKATNGEIIDGDSTSEKIGSNSLWYAFQNIKKNNIFWQKKESIKIKKIYYFYKH